MYPKHSKNSIYSYYSIGALAIFGLLFLWLGFLGKSESVFVNSTDTNSYEPLTHFLTLMSLTLAFGFMIIALHRRDRILELQQRLVNQQAKEIGFHRRAIDSHSIISKSTVDNTITDVNDNFVDAFGFSRKEIVGKKHIVLFPEGKQSTAWNTQQGFAGAGKMWTGEQKLRKKNGDPIFVQTTMVPLFDEDDDHIENVCMRTDITKQRLAEADRYLTSMLGQLQDEVYVYDTDTLKISYMNELARKRCEWSEEEACTRKISDTSKNFDTAIFRDHVNPLFTGERKSVVIETKHEKGYVEICTWLYDGLNGVPTFVSVLRDVTERKIAEKKKQEIIAMVSHELRTPLTSIKGALRLLQSGAAGDISENTSAIVDIAARNSDRLLHVVNDILDFEKIQAGMMDFSTKRINLAEFVEDAAAINKGYGDEHKVTFVTTSLDRCATIDGNPERLHQVMSNLISNAAKFSPDGGQIDLEITDAGNMWRVSVGDTGPGIPESARKMIFDRFSQVENVDSQKWKGTGLGLAITKKIIERHSGTIDYSSVVGEGTTFYFELLKTRQAGQRTGPAPESVAAE